MPGYEKSMYETASMCRELKQHESNMIVEHKKWDEAYCNSSTVEYNNLLTSVQKLYLTAATEGEMLDEYQNFTEMVVYPEGDPEACDAARKRRQAESVGAAPTAPANSQRYSTRLRRNTPKRWRAPGAVQAKAVTSDRLVVTGKVVLRKTDNYNATSNEQLQEAIIAVINDNNTDTDLEVDPDTVKVDSVEPKFCNVDVFCPSQNAFCVNTTDPELNVIQGRCQCLSSYQDFSPNNETNPGEICIKVCDSSFCSKGGECKMDYDFYTRSCSCLDWYYKGEKCSTDLRIVIGSVVSVVVVAGVLLATLFYTRWYRRRSREDAQTSADTVSSREGEHNEGYSTLPRNAEVTQEGSDDGGERATSDVPVVIPRPVLGRPPVRELLRDPDIWLTEAGRNPAHQDWYISQNIPRPYLSL